MRLRRSTALLVVAWLVTFVVYLQVRPAPRRATYDPSTTATVPLPPATAPPSTEPPRPDDPTTTTTTTDPVDESTTTAPEASTTSTSSPDGEVPASTSTTSGS